jgi:hypothetical protein
MIDAEKVNKLIARLHDALDKMHEAALAPDRGAYLAAREVWQRAESELRELLPPETDPKRP